MTSPGDVRAAAGPAGRTVAACAAIVLASGLAGLAGGLIWAWLAPHPLYQITGPDVAYVVNAETTAFITGDAWYCLVGLAGGVIIGVAGYLLAVRRYGPAPMAAVLAGSVAAGLAARWSGQQSGLGAFNAQLASGHPGALLHAPPVLGTDSTKILWPAIMTWPFAACLAAGMLTLIWSARGQASREPAPAATTDISF